LVPRYIRNGRDVAEWAHIDILFQPYLNAALILLRFERSGREDPFDAK